MKLAVSHYRHPGEPITLVASVWLAVTLILLAHVLAIWLIAIHPFSAWVAIPLGVIILAWLDAGIAIGILRARAHVEQLRAKARAVGPAHLPRVHEAAELVAERLGLPATPPLYVLPLSEPDSFSLDWGRLEVFVTEGLVDALDDLALRAALAHEMAHVRGRHTWLAMVALLPLRARPSRPLLLGAFALAALALRPWLRVAEYSVDRAAAIAVGGAEPVAHWLTVAREGHEGPLDADLSHFLTFGGDQYDRAFAEAELRVAHPAIATRVIELARFARSRRFANCLAIVGDLRMEPVDRVSDPASAGLGVFVIIGLLAGLWLAPLTVAIAVALGNPAASSEPVVTAPPAVGFSPNAPELAQPAAPTAPSPAPQLSPAEDVEGLIEVARMHKNHGDLPRARQALEAAILADPTSLEAHRVLAWVYAESNEKDLAAQEFTAVMNLADPNSDKYQEAAAALKRLGY